MTTLQTLQTADITPSPRILWVLGQMHYKAMCKTGDAHKSNHCAGSILRAAVMISEWKEPI